MSAIARAAVLGGLTLWAAPVAADPPASVTPLEAAARRTAPSGKATIAVLAQGKNAFVGRLELAPHAQVPIHRDATEEYIHVLEGTGTLTIDGKAHRVGPGTTIFMPAQAEVSYRNGDTRMIALQIFAGPAPAAKYQGWKPAR